MTNLLLNKQEDILSYIHPSIHPPNFATFPALGVTGVEPITASGGGVVTPWTPVE